MAVIARHPGAAIAIINGHSADRVMLIGADTADERQWRQVVERVTRRFGRIDSVVRAGEATLRVSA